MGGDERAAGGAILVIDDDRAVLAVVSRMLQRYGYTAHVAASGEAAAEILEREEGVDLIVADLRMPGVSGVELVNRARALHPRVAVIYISGYADEQGSLPPGATVLEKPFTRAQLLRAVGDALAEG